ncbi:hypothetical protein PRIPAC_74758 [Pristionchus pacificus]|uniref:Uncharacterized protein n=1 Tax=Pristionchus pacificus TaxID=54126 RepID=A0A2A6C7H7_PRIPA|nr:hypothetical protein PRIPAC_74758 [Pristionchus pacificus]|eukprot:PDM73991.1 hypothetical protein PRIPAC_41347 [Pristionchus pacificus]
MDRCRADKLVHSRVLAVLTCIVSGYNMIMVISSVSSSWDIALRSVLFGLHVIAAMSTFSAIGFNIPLLMVPIILVSILTLLVNAVFCVLSITALADGDSFYGSYIRSHHASKGGSGSDSAVRSYAINTAITSGIMVLLNLRSCFVHVTAYRLIKERRYPRLITVSTTSVRSYP